MTVDGTHPPAGLHDVLAPGLRVLIVAINPSSRSAAIGRPFSSPGNPFWRLLHVSGLTPVQLRPDESDRLVEFGIGLASTVSRATRAATDLSMSERRAGALRVRAVVETLRPAMVALLGLTLYPVFFPSSRSPGPGPQEVRLGGSRVYVLPNPSGRNRAYPGFEAKLAWYRDLAELVDS